MASHDLIEAYLTDLRRELPTDTVEELADGLIETYQRQLAAGADPEAAAVRATAEFGPPDTIIAAFTRQAPGRRAAVRLLVTGPFVGLCWATALLTGHAWAWPVPTVARFVVGSGLLLTVAALATAATSRRSYARTRIAAVGGCGLIALDTTMIIVAVLVAPVFVWPMAAAIPASLTRIGATVRAMPLILTR
jgi:hypothetical protein